MQSPALFSGFKVRDRLRLEVVSFVEVSSQGQPRRIDVCVQHPLVAAEDPEHHRQAIPRSLTQRLVESQLLRLDDREYYSQKTRRKGKDWMFDMQDQKSQMRRRQAVLFEVYPYGA